MKHNPKLKKKVFSSYGKITIRLPQLCAREPFGGVTVQTDHVLPGVMGGKSELALAAIHLYTNLTNSYSYTMTLKK